MQPYRRRIIIAVSALGAAGPLSKIARAQSHENRGYPDKFVRIIVPFPPGGGADVVTRILAKQLSNDLGQPFVIENRAGAQGNIGAGIAARSPADGYTILFAYAGTHAINPSLYKELPFKESDFEPIIWLSQVPQVLVVNPSIPAHNVLDLIAFAKEKPDQLSYSSAGPGSVPHLSAELFKMMTSVQLLHVPYKGGAPSVLACASGEVSLTFAEPSNVLPYVQSGKLRILAITTARPSVALPDVPTIADSGVPGYDVGSWNGILVPAGTPPAVIDRLNLAFNQVLENREVRDSLIQLSYEPIGGKPEDFGRFIQSETEKWRKVIAATGMRAE